VWLEAKLTGRPDMADVGIAAHGVQRVVREQRLRAGQFCIKRHQVSGQVSQPERDFNASSILISYD